MVAFIWDAKRRLVCCAGLLLTLAACEKDDPGPSAHAGASGAQNEGATAGTGAGGNAAGGGSGGALTAGAGSGGVTAPDGFTLVPGLELSDHPASCEGLSVSCSGRCVDTTEETNRCQALGVARIFSEVVRDENGTYLSEQRSSSSSLWSIDATSGTLVQLAEPAGDNQHLRLALDDGLLYFVSNRTLFSVPRAGGEPTELLAELPNANQFVVIGGRMFGKIALDPEIHELDLAGGPATVHDRDATGLARSGDDIYFAEADLLYRAANADLTAAVMVGSDVTTIIGFSGDWVYALGGQDGERAIRRFPKAGGSGQVIFMPGGKGPVALANDAVAFITSDGPRHYLCTVTLEGNAPTIHGYLPSSPTLLAADENYLYATIGFNMIRVKR